MQDRIMECPHCGAENIAEYGGPSSYITIGVCLSCQSETDLRLTKPTPAERRLLTKLGDTGEAWIVPAQSRMARRLESYALIEITKETRTNVLRGSAERRVIPGHNLTTPKATTP